MRHAQRIFAVLIMVMSFPVFGKGESDRTPEYSKYIEKSGGADPAIQDCISAEYTRQDKRLNNAYRKLLGLLKPERKKQLQEAQRLWIKYTEANCDFYYDPEGGTSARLSASECAVSARIARSKELEDLVQFQPVTQ